TVSNNYLRKAYLLSLSKKTHIGTKEINKTSTFLLAHLSSDYTKSESVNNSDDSEIIVRTIVSGASFPFWELFEEIAPTQNAQQTNALDCLGLLELGGARILSQSLTTFTSTST
ncbi:6373_t:CDS:2, partial [Gigaspora margarita]